MACEGGCCFLGHEIHTKHSLQVQLIHSCSQLIQVQSADGVMAVMQRPLRATKDVKEFLREAGVMLP